MAVSGSVLCIGCLLAVALLYTVSGAPVADKSTEGSGISKLKSNTAEQKQIVDNFLKMLNGYEDELKKSMKEQTRKSLVKEESSDSLAKFPFMFPRVQVEKNNCPNCVPGSFRWTV